MDQGRAEFLKSVGWMVLWQTKLSCGASGVYFGPSVRVMMSRALWSLQHKILHKENTRRGYFCCSFGAELFLFGRMKVVFFSPTQTRNTLYHYPWGGLSTTSLSSSSSNWQGFLFICWVFFFPLTQVPKDWVRCWSAHSKLLIPVYWSCPRRECGVQCHDKYQLWAPAIVPAALNRLVLLWGNVTCWVGMLVHACANALSKWVELN